VVLSQTRPKHGDMKAMRSFLRVVVATECKSEGLTILYGSVFLTVPLFREAVVSKGGYIEYLELLVHIQHPSLSFASFMTISAVMGTKPN